MIPVEIKIFMFDDSDSDSNHLGRFAYLTNTFDPN